MRHPPLVGRLMRILMVHPGPDFSVADVFNGWHKALLRQGHDIQVYNTNERLSFYSQIKLPDYENPGEYRSAMNEDQCTLAAFQGLSHELYSFWPQLVIFVSGFFVRADHLRLIRSRFHKIVMLHTESPYQDDEQLMRAQFAHLNLLNDPTNLHEYQALSPSVYMPHAYDPEVHFPRDVRNFSPQESDFSFIGTMFRSRQLFFEEMLDSLKEYKGIQVKTTLGGSGWDQDHLDDSPLLRFLSHPRDQSVDNADTAQAYRDTRTGINVYRRESEDGHRGEGWAMGPREVEMAACGLPFLRDSRPEGDEVFKGILPVFSSPGDAAGKLVWLLKNEGARQGIAERARRAIEDRTFDANARVMMRELEKRYRL